MCIFAQDLSNNPEFTLQLWSVKVTAGRMENLHEVINRAHYGTELLRVKYILDGMFLYRYIPDRAHYDLRSMCSHYQQVFINPTHWLFRILALCLS